MTTLLKKNRKMDTSDDSFFSDSSQEATQEPDPEPEVTPPEHRFDIKSYTTKTGKSKGQVRALVTLVIPPYTFKKRRVNRFSWFR